MLDERKEEGQPDRPPLFFVSGLAACWGIACLQAGSALIDIANGIGVVIALIYLLQAFLTRKKQMLPENPQSTH